MRVLVTGGRDFKDTALLVNVLEDLKLNPGIDLLIVGDATGADAIAREWAEQNRIPLKIEYASWALQGVMAGMIRNVRMIERHKPDLVVAAPGGAGTEHCIKNALLRGVKVRRLQ